MDPPSIADLAHRRRNILAEIVSTEQTYVKCLQLLHDDYFKAFKEARDTHPHLFEEDDFKNLAGQLPGIYEYHKSLLRQLEERIQVKNPEDACIGDIFQQASKVFVLYIPYVNGYEQAFLTLNKRLKSAADISVWLENKKKEANVDLASLMITPIQRIPRYQLLLTELSKNTTPQHADYNNLTIALNAIVDVAKQINAKKRMFDQIWTVAEIQTSISDEIKIVQPYRSHIKNWELNYHVDPTSVGQPSRLSLFNDSVLLATRAGYRWKYISFFSLKEMKLSSVPERSTWLCIALPVSKPLLLSASSEDKIASIRETLDSCKRASGQLPRTDSANDILVAPTLLRFPFATEGGPANASKGFWSRWWHASKSTPGLQLQYHRASSYGGLAISEMKKIRAAKGAKNLDCYRIILTEPPKYWCIASSDDWDEIVREFEHVKAFLAPCKGDLKEMLLKVASTKWRLVASELRACNAVFSENDINRVRQRLNVVKGSESCEVLFLKEKLIQLRAALSPEDANQTKSDDQALLTPFLSTELENAFQAQTGNVKDASISWLQELLQDPKIIA